MESMVSSSHLTQRAFNPYTENGGTILAIAGADFSVIAGDTRQSEGYSIQTRYAPKVFRLYVQLFSFVSTYFFIVMQNRQGCIGCKWFRCRREHVRKESAATSRGVYTNNWTILITRYLILFNCLVV